MKTKWLGISLSCALCFSAVIPLTSVEGGVWDRIKTIFSDDEEKSSPSLRVLLLHDVQSVLLEVKGNYNVYDPYTNSKIASRFGAKANLLIVTSNGIKWGEEFPGVYQIQVVPDDPNTSVLVNGIEYKGSVYVYDVGGTISIVNELPIEEYIQAQMASKADAKMDQEALNAIAIALRTEAYQAAYYADNPFWHVDAVGAEYIGSGVIRKNSALHKAVKETQYIVMSTSSIYRGSPVPSAPALVFSRQSYSRDGSASVVFVEEIQSLAEKGYTADKIIQRLFPDTQLASLKGGHSNRMRHIAERD